MKPQQARQFSQSFQRAAQLIQRGDLFAAQQVLAPLQRKIPKHPEVLRLSGILHHHRGEYANAIQCYRKALSQQPKRAVIYNNLGSALRADGQFEQAVSAFRHALKLDDNLAAAWYNLGKTYKKHADMNEACEALQQALKRAPRHQAAGITLGDTYKALGQLAEAENAYRQVLSIDPDQATAWWALSNLKTMTFNNDDITRIQAAAKRQKSKQQRVRILFTLFKALEDAQHYAEAFNALVEANKLQSELHPWDVKAFSAETQRIEESCQQSIAVQPEYELHDGQGVIFIVSLPRSGSTLLEQMLSSHPNIEGASELGDIPHLLNPVFNTEETTTIKKVQTWQAEQWHELGQQYWQRTRRWRNNGNRWFVDKLPNNWQWSEAILRMLPQAIIIDCRRDPRECCFSNYTQLFARIQNFSYDLDDLAHYWDDYQRMMNGVGQRYPGRVLGVSYEQLVDQPEPTLKQVFSFLGLGWDDRCLKFYESKRVVRTASAAQVRQPLFKPASARWKRYDKHLAALNPMYKTQ